LSGPLAGVRVLELAGIGPAPFACMMLADMGADVIRVDRADAVRAAKGRPSRDLLARGRQSIGVDLKHPQGLEMVLRLADASDVLVEGFRPGVTERMGLGPDICTARNPRLVYGRMTGWGQQGPCAKLPGHDINYIALAGSLDFLGRSGGPPTPPANLLGDFGGGGMMLAFGVACALAERASSGRGQVIDAAIIDGAALLTTFFQAMPLGPRGTNVLDTGAPFYDVYECSDGGYISIGALEPQFYANLRKVLGLDASHWDQQMDRACWPAQRAELTGLFKTRTRDQWCEVFDGEEACFAPVLTFEEAPAHPHNAYRETFVEREGFRQAAPGPRFSRSRPELGHPPARPGAHTDEILAGLGLSQDEIAALRAADAVR
jgi:alpha-methylacyl-CoA racemase